MRGRDGPGGGYPALRTVTAIASRSLPRPRGAQWPAIKSPAWNELNAEPVLNELYVVPPACELLRELRCTAMNEDCPDLALRNALELLPVVQDLPDVSLRWNALLTLHDNRGSFAVQQDYVRSGSVLELQLADSSGRVRDEPVLESMRERRDEVRK